MQSGELDPLLPGAMEIALLVGTLVVLVAVVALVVTVVRRRSAAVARDMLPGHQVGEVDGQ